MVGLMHKATNRVHGCGHRVRSGGVNALSRKQGPWVWSVSEKWWG